MWGASPAKRQDPRTLSPRAVRRAVGRTTARAAVLASLLACGCARTADLAPAPDPERPAGFAAAPQLLSGFEIGPDPLKYRTGDRVLLGLRVERASEVVEKYLLITLMSNFTVVDSTMRFNAGGDRSQARVASYMAIAAVFDGQGRPLGRTPVNVPAVCLATGLFDYGAMTIEAASLDAPARERLKSDRAWRDRANRAFVSLVLQGGMLRDTRDLRDLAEGVIRRPNVLDLMFGDGFSIKEGAPARTGSTVVLDTGPLPSVDMQEEFWYGWTLLGRLSGRFVPCVPPLGLAGGLVEGTADNPGHGPKISVRLLAARRGDGEPWTPEPMEFTPVN